MLLFFYQCKDVSNKRTALPSSHTSRTTERLLASLGNSRLQKKKNPIISKVTCLFFSQLWFSECSSRLQRTHHSASHSRYCTHLALPTSCFTVFHKTCSHTKHTVFNYISHFCLIYTAPVPFTLWDRGPVVTFNPWKYKTALHLWRTEVKEIEKGG